MEDSVVERDEVEDGVKVDSGKVMERLNTLGPLPLVMFSGGLDSTMMLSRMLKETQVDVMYVSGPQGTAKSRKEEEARAAILLWMDNNRPYPVRSVIDFRLPEGDMQRGTKYGQVLPWLYGGMATANGRQHTSLAIGYVMGDDITEHLVNLEKAWDLLSNVSKSEPVKLTFPLRNTTKQQLLQEIPSDLYKLIWYCEIPKEGKACGRCEACLTHAAELHMHGLRGHPHPNGEPARMKITTIPPFKILDTIHTSMSNRLAEFPNGIGGVESDWSFDQGCSVLSFTSATRRAEVTYAFDEESDHPHMFHLSKMEMEPSFEARSLRFNEANVKDGMQRVVDELFKRVTTPGVEPQKGDKEETYEVLSNLLRYYTKKGGISIWRDFEYPSSGIGDISRADLQFALSEFATKVGEESMLMYIRKAVRQAGPEESSSSILHRILGNTTMS